MTKANTKKAFRIISVFEIVFAICASFSWSGGYILQEFIHIDPTTFLHNIVVFVFEFYFIGFPLALIFSFILLSINSDKKIMPAKPLVLLCVCPFIFAAGMYSMVISQSNSFFLLGSLIISVVNIIIQIYFITEIKKSKNYTPPVEASESAVNKKRNTVKALAAINTALILITTACFMIPPWLSLYNLADISDASVPLIAPMALGIIFGSILLNENAKTGFLPARTVNAAFAFEFLFPIIIWISNKIQFELTFTGPIIRLKISEIISL